MPEPASSDSRSSGPRSFRVYQRRLKLASVGWAVCVIAATWILGVLELRGAIGWVVAAVPTVVGLVVVRTYFRLIRQADELQRQIHLEGLAAGFGAAAVSLLGYRFLQLAGAPEIDLFYLFALICGIQAFAYWFAQRRFR